MTSITIKNSVLPKKRFLAIFTKEDGKTKKVNFGSKGAYTYIDGADETIKENYLKRHKIREDWDNYMSAGSLSRFIIWGSSRNINENIANFRKKFNLK